MSRRIVTFGIAIVAILGTSWVAHHYLFGSHDNSDVAINGTPGNPDAEVAIGSPLYLPPSSTVPRVSTETRDGLVAEPLVIGGCRLTAFEKEDVPSERDGTLWFLGTEAADGETIPPENAIVVPQQLAGKRYRRLHEGDVVKNGQLLAHLDDRQARAEFASKSARIAAAEADRTSSEKAREEAQAKYENGLSLYAKRALAKEELGERRLAMEKFKYEAKGKEQAVKVAQLEAEQARTILEMHEIRSSIDGIIKTIYKNPGEGVKSAPAPEPVFQIVNLSRLRVEGLMDEQHLPQLHPGDDVLVEAATSQAPNQIYLGHLQEVTGVAFTRDSKLIVSSSLDNTVRVWERALRRERRILRHPAQVLAVACTPAAGPNLCVSGCADGSVRIWDLNDPSPKPVRTLAGAGNHAAITCVAFTPDGAYFATGSEDREIALWETATGAAKYKVLGHTGAITSLQFTPQSQLVSASRDNTIRLWSLGTEASRLENTITRRSGDVALPGVSPDGQQVLFDPWQSKALRLLSLPEGLTEGVLEEAAGSERITTFALFSPEGDAVLTAVGGEGQVQLWKLPDAKSRAHVRRRLVTPHRAPASSAAFAPDGGCCAVGTRDRQILVFPRDCPEELKEQLHARVTHIERAVDSNQVRVWAVLQNPGGRLMPGSTVTMVRYPK